MIKFSIVITTKNRLDDLKITIKSLSKEIERDDVEILICDDASNDGTQVFLKKYYSNFILIFNKTSKGLIYNRNVLNNMAKGEYIISLDDDVNFLHPKNPLDEIENYFNNNIKCSVISFRLFWSIKEPSSIKTIDTPIRVSSYLGGAHAFKKQSWCNIPNYPSWFLFYGEENFASFHLFKKNLEIHYLPSILSQHRVDSKIRKMNKDYYLRLKRSLRSGWYLYGMFYPIKKIPRLFFYTLWVQLKNKVIKERDLKALIAIFKAMVGVVLNLPQIIAHSSRLTHEQLINYKKLPKERIFWTPEKNK